MIQSGLPGAEEGGARASALSLFFACGCTHLGYIGAVIILNSK